MARPIAFAVCTVSLCFLVLHLTPECRADVLVLSVNRGVSVDLDSSTNHATGVFDTSLFNTNTLGTAEANIRSNITINQFDATGFSSEFATELDTSSDIRSHSFFEVTFELFSPHDYDLTGYAAGSSDSEHYYSAISLVGPSTNLLFGGQNAFMNLDETGTLGPGVYTFLAESYPIVYGGLDQGWAESGFDATIRFTSTSIPEPGALAIATLFAAGLMFRRKRPQ